MSLASAVASSNGKDSKVELNNENSLNETGNIKIKFEQNIKNSIEITSESEQNLDKDAYKFLMKVFQDNGFQFYIDYTDLIFDFKTDFGGGGGYGEVFKA